jgi:hypothetical protein
MIDETNICRVCCSGKHDECNGYIIKKIKKPFLRGYREVETSNLCECPCCGITNESNLHFREKLGPDIHETKHI